jgi:hypothetical protein
MTTISPSQTDEFLGILRAEDLEEKRRLEFVSEQREQRSLRSLARALDIYNRGHVLDTLDPEEYMLPE